MSRFQLFCRYKPMPKIHRNRRSIRLPDYDYTTPGAYLVNICTQNRECLFGEIMDSKIVFNDLGRLVVKSWIWLAEQYPCIELDEFIIMPNNLHGILVVSDHCRGSSRTAPTWVTTKKPKSKNCFDNHYNFYTSFCSTLPCSLITAWAAARRAMGTR